jgi:hypothetical protein
MTSPHDLTLRHRIMAEPWPVTVLQSEYRFAIAL